MSIRLAGLATVLAIVFTLINPVPASAHIAGSGGSPSNYQTTVTAIRPVLPAVGVTVGLGGQWVRVTNQGAAEIVIVGYRGEPFLRLSDNRVQASNLSSTAAETGHIAVAPVSVTPSTEPSWVQLRDGDSATRNDAQLDPPPDSELPSGSWELPLVVDGQQVTVLGTRDRIPPPSPWPWMVALGLLTAAVAAIGWRRNWHRPMAAAIAGGILAFVLHLFGTGFAPQERGAVYGWVGVGAVSAFSILIGSVAVVSTLRRSESAPRGSSRSGS